MKRDFYQVVYTNNFGTFNIKNKSFRRHCRLREKDVVVPVTEKHETTDQRVLTLCTCVQMATLVDGLERKAQTW